MPNAGQDRPTVAPHLLMVGIRGGGDGIAGQSARCASLMTRGQFQTQSCASAPPSLGREMGDGRMVQSLSPARLE